MKNKNTYLLLKIVKNNGNVKRLIHENLEFKDIADLTALVIEKGLVIFDNDGLRLSEKGEELFTELQVNYIEHDKDKWIKKENESRVQKLDKNFLYLPNQNELDL